MKYITNLLYFGQVALYIVIMLCAVAFVVPIALEKSDGVWTAVDGGPACLLYGQVKWSDRNEIQVAKYGSPAVCNFILGIGTVLILYCTIFGSLHALMFIFGHQTKHAFTRGFVGYPLFHGVYIAFVFIAACMITIGFKTWCEGFNDYMSPIGVKPNNTCSYLQDTVHLQGHPDVAVSLEFYGRFSRAESASWICFMFMVFLFIVSVLRWKRFLGQEDGDEIERTPIVVEPTEPQAV